MTGPSNLIVTCHKLSIYQTCKLRVTYPTVVTTLAFVLRAPTVILGTHSRFTLLGIRASTYPRELTSFLCIFACCNRYIGPPPSSLNHLLLDQRSVWATPHLEMPFEACRMATLRVLSTAPCASMRELLMHAPTVVRTAVGKDAAAIDMCCACQRVLLSASVLAFEFDQAIIAPETCTFSDRRTPVNSWVSIGGTEGRPTTDSPS